VIPADAAGLVRKVLDPALFDVTALIQNGYDDRRAAYTPLIVQYAGAANSRTAPFGGGLRNQRSLTSIQALAGRQSKAESATFRRALPALAAPGAGGVRRIWLDRQVKATVEPDSSTVDANLTQIGAPDAWQAGYTGAGVRVAVLDTGVDASHPDLAGRVTESVNFTDDADAVDRNGHGTHVAATIAGSGAASKGRHRGVAPDARLLVGKVLNAYGWGEESWLIAAMEWAAPRAQVVNMSLGTFEYSDGNDALSAAVDALSHRTGALFVAAAGNSGPHEGTVGAPGAASTALTVGAVDGTDTLADFSSRGPLINTRWIKPEIVAPGVDIISARAAGTAMGRVIDERYTAASGTSMATPHAAGSAAILKQRYPAWRGEQLKASLVASADPARGGDAYAVGGGRLDIPSAMGAPAAGRNVVNFGILPYPQSGTTEAGLSWVNTGAKPVTLTLAVNVTDRYGQALPEDVVGLSAITLTLAPGQTGSAVLRIDQDRLAGRFGLFVGTVTARTGTRELRNPVAFYVEPPTYTLTVRATALHGTPRGALYGYVSVINIDDPVLLEPGASIAGDGLVSLRVPKGRYSVMGMVGDDTPGAGRTSLVGDPDVLIDADTTLVFDGARAQPVTATVEGVATTPSAIGLFYVQTPRRGEPWWAGLFAWVGTDWSAQAVYTAAIPGVEVGTLAAYEYFSLDATMPDPRRYDLMRSLGGTVPADPAYRVSAAEQATLARIDQRFHRLDTPASSTGHKRYGLSPEGALAAENDSQSLPFTRTDYVTSGISWLDEAFYSDVPVDFSPVVTQESFRRYAPGSRQEKTWVRQPLRPDWYDDPQPSPSECAPRPIRRTSGNLHVELVELADQHQRFSCLTGDTRWEESTTRTLTLQRNGRKIAQVTGSSGDFTIPAEAATYRLTYDLGAGAVLPISTRVSTTWTFRSIGPGGTESVPVRLLSVDYALPLNDVNRPNGDEASFTVRQAVGVPPQRIVAFELWMSTDDGTSWRAVPAVARDADRFVATLPTVEVGRPVSLRVRVSGDAGSQLDQTIIRAYRTQ
jgi:subtilisin family serine protease